MTATLHILKLRQKDYYIPLDILKYCFLWAFK